MPSRIAKVALGTAATATLASVVAVPTSAQAEAPAADLKLTFGTPPNGVPTRILDASGAAIPVDSTVTMQAGGSLDFTMIGTIHQPVIYQVRGAETPPEGLTKIAGRAVAGSCVTEIGTCSSPTTFATSLTGGDRQAGNLFLGDVTAPTGRILGAGDYVVYCNNPNHARTGGNMRIVVHVDPVSPTP